MATTSVGQKACLSFHVVVFFHFLLVSYYVFVCYFILFFPPFYLILFSLRVAFLISFVSAYLLVLCVVLVHGLPAYRLIGTDIARRQCPIHSLFSYLAFRRPFGCTETKQTAYHIGHSPCTTLSPLSRASL